MPRPLDARRPVAFFANGIGDHLLNLPALRALGDLFRGRLRLICMTGSRATFFADLPLAGVFEAETWSEDHARHFDVAALGARIGDCDLLLSLNPWHSPSVDQLLQRLMPEQSIGFFPGFDVMLARDYSKHNADLAFDVPQWIAPELRLEDFSAAPRWPTDARGLAEAIRSEIPVGMYVLAIHADTKPEKMWPVEHWVALLDMLLEHWPDIFVLVLGRERLSLDKGRFGDRVIPCYGLPLAASLALAGQADVFVGVDSCMLHAADLAGVPGLGLFGPTNPAEFGFRLAPHRHIANGGAMTAIPVHEVAAAFNELMAEIRPPYASGVSECLR